jgi:hypothetical protein
MIVGLMLIAVVAALYMARPGLFTGAGGLELEDVGALNATSGLNSAAFGDLQVAGIRPWYTSEYETKVRALVINHGETALSGVELQVNLRPREAPAESPPLASFVISLDKELAPQQSHEIEADLEAMGTLASFPSWKRIRVDLEAR